MNVVTEKDQDAFYQNSDLDVTAEGTQQSEDRVERLKPGRSEVLVTF